MGFLPYYHQAILKTGTGFLYGSKLGSKLCMILNLVPDKVALKVTLNVFQGQQHLQF